MYTYVTKINWITIYLNWAHAFSKYILGAGHSFFKRCPSSFMFIIIEEQMLETRNTPSMALSDERINLWYRELMRRGILYKRCTIPIFRTRKLRGQGSCEQKSLKPLVYRTSARMIVIRRQSDQETVWINLQHRQADRCHQLGRWGRGVLGRRVLLLLLPVLGDPVKKKGGGEKKTHLNVLLQ